MNSDFLQFFVDLLGLDTLEEKVKYVVIELFVQTVFGQITYRFEVAVLQLGNWSRSNLLGKEFLLLRLEEVAVIGDELQGFHFILRIVNKNHNFLSNIFVEFFLSCQKAEDIVGALNKLEMSFSRIPDDFQQAVSNNPVNEELRAEVLVDIIHGVVLD